MSQGYVRVSPFNRPDAVVWWYSHAFADGFVFARGGSVRTNRQARHAINDCKGMSEREHRRYVERPVARLMDDGSLEPINYGPYDIALTHRHQR